MLVGKISTPNIHSLPYGNSIHLPNIFIMGVKISQIFLLFIAMAAPTWYLSKKRDRTTRHWNVNICGNGRHFTKGLIQNLKLEQDLIGLNSRVKIWCCDKTYHVWGKFCSNCHQIFHYNNSVNVLNQLKFLHVITRSIGPSMNCMECSNVSFISKICRISRALNEVLTNVGAMVSLLRPTD